MKKYIAVLLAVLTVFLCACNTGNNEETTTEETPETTLPPEVTTVESLSLEELEPSKVLTVYFSHTDQVYALASYISELTEGGLYRIETIGTYPEDEAELVKRVHDEHIKDVRPALKNAPPSLSEYNIIFLCFPSWDNTMPMALFTFIEDYDMRDKIVIPVINGSYAALENAIRDINLLVPGMLVAKGYSMESDIVSEKAQFDEWLNTTLYG